MAQLSIPEHGSLEKKSIIYHRFFIRECISGFYIWIIESIICGIILGVLLAISAGVTQDILDGKVSASKVGDVTMGIIPFYVILALAYIGMTIYQICRVLALHDKITNIDNKVLANLK